MMPLLFSINNQVGVNFDEIEIVIANDGDGAGPLDTDFCALFDVEIRQVNMPENKGPGVVRQVGIDAAAGDYVLCCDADDILYSVGFWAL